MNDEDIKECFIILYGEEPYINLWKRNDFHNDNYDSLFFLKFKIKGPLPCKIYTLYDKNKKCRILTNLNEIDRDYIKWMENSFPSKESAIDFLNKEIDFKILSLKQRVSRLEQSKI